MPEQVTNLLAGELLALAGIALLVMVTILVSRLIRGRAGGRHRKTRHRQTGTVADLRAREHADQLRYYPTAGHTRSAPAGFRGA